MVRYFGGRTQTSAAFAAWTLVWATTKVVQIAVED
jgi:hypothetical protein